MHAWYFGQPLWKFLSVDRFNLGAASSGDAEHMRRFREHSAMPRSWDRYSDTRDSPMLYIER